MIANKECFSLWGQQLCKFLGTNKKKSSIPTGLFFVHQHRRRDVTRKGSLEARPTVPQCCVSYIKGYFQLFLLVGTWKARPKTSFSAFPLHSPSNEELSRKVTASSPGRISVLPVPKGRGMRQGRRRPSSVFACPINGRWGWNVNPLKKLELFFQTVKK